MIIFKRLRSLFRMTMPYTFRRSSKGGLRYYEIIQAGNLQYYLLTLPFILTFVIVLPVLLVPLGFEAALDASLPVTNRLIIGAVTFLGCLLPLGTLYYLLAPSGMDSSREGKLLDMELTFKTEFTIGSGVIELKNTPDAHSLQIDKVTHITIRNPDITEHYQIPGKISSRGPARHHKSIKHHSDPFDYSGVFLNMFIPDTFNVDVETADYVMTVSRMLPQGRAVALAKSIAQDMGLKIKQSPGNFAAYKAAFEVVK